ncbi:hypothetical protein AVEN_195412-1, partial [Araneus ventricosus]
RIEECSSPARSKPVPKESDESHLQQSALKLRWMPSPLHASL